MKKIINIFLVLFVFAGLTIFSLVIAQNPGTGNQGQDDPGAQDQQAGQGQDDEQGNGQDGEQGNGEGEGEGDQVQNQQQEQVQTQTQEQNEEGLGNLENGQQLRARTSNELKSMIQDKRGEMIEEIKLMKGNLKKAYENQNEVRAAVHGLLAMEDLVGGIGKQVSEVANQFNNSVEQTIKAEETIMNRNRVLRFLLVVTMRQQKNYRIWLIRIV